MKTDNHLFHDNSHYELRGVKLEYALARVLSEKFTIKLVLPEGAHNVKVRIGRTVYD